MFDDEISSLFSLLGLLEPSEFFITVDHSALWQKHISWAKSGGEDLRQHITQRYASSMVFLSCLLAAQINVFFNSSKEITEMRACLQTQRMSTLKYWTGVVIMCDICVTILALVNTYTLSKLIASISDNNAHAMLRSSIGSYVAILPSRFTVAALYLFLGWIALFIWEFFTGPIHFFLLLFVFFMFFHVIIPLSAFGRLIIHTGAMGRRPVLDVELEKELLPSGLHNSLLIRATDRKRKYNSSATDQYRKPSKSHSQRGGHGMGSVPSSTMYGTSSYQIPGTGHGSSVPVSYYTRDSYTTNSRALHPPRDITFGDPRNDDADDLTVEGDGDEDHLHTDFHELDGNNANHMGSSEEFPSVVVEGIDPEMIDRNYSGGQHSPRGGHRRIQTMDTVGSDNFFFPQAHILNATTRTKDIRQIVQQSMYLSATGADATTNASSTMYSSGMGSNTTDTSQQKQQDQRPSPSNVQSGQLPETFKSESPTKEKPGESPELTGGRKDGDNNQNNNTNSNDDAAEQEDVENPSVPSSSKALVTTTQVTETINSPAGLGRNISTTSVGHRRQMSSGGGSPRLTLLPSNTTADHYTRLGHADPAVDPIHAGMRYLSPDIPGSHKYYAPPPPPPPPPQQGSYGQYLAPSSQQQQVQQQQVQQQQAQQQQQQQQQRQRHPLLSDSTPSETAASSSRPPTHSRLKRHTHRRRSSAGRRSSGSILGFIPLPSPAENELEEENAIRASLDMPLAPDLDSQERLVEEQKNQQDNPYPQPSQAVASTWLAMHSTPAGEGAGRRRASSAGHVTVEDNMTMAYDNRTVGYRSNSRRNLMMTPDDGGRVYRSSSRRNIYESGGYRPSSSRRNLMRQANDDFMTPPPPPSQQQQQQQQPQSGYRSSSRRNLMATINSHPDEEKEDEDEQQRSRNQRQQQATATIPEETTRLLADHDGDNNDGDRHRSYT